MGRCLKPIVFSITEYPIEGGFNGSGYQKLKKEIAKQRVFAGFNVTTVGGSNKIKVFRCKHGVKYCSDRTAMTNKSYIHLQLVTTETTITLTYTKRCHHAICTDELCKFHFSIYF